MYYVYSLLNYRNYVYYIGMTKNLEIRIREHTMNKNASKAKIYRTRKTIAQHGYLPYTYEGFETKEEAVKREAELINKFRHQLVNKTFGKVKKEAKQRRSKGRSTQCPYCLCYFKQIKRHKCKHKDQ